MRWIHLVLTALLLCAGINALARVVPVSYTNVSYVGPSNAYAGGYVASPYGVTVGLNLPHRVIAVNASPTIFGYRVSGVVVRKPSVDVEHYRVQEYPRHGYWHGEGDHIYVYNSAYYNGHPASQGANGYYYTRN